MVLRSECGGGVRFFKEGYFIDVRVHMLCHGGNCIDGV